MEAIEGRAPPNSTFSDSVSQEVVQVVALVSLLAPLELRLCLILFVGRVTAGGGAMVEDGGCATKASTTTSRFLLSLL